MHDLRRAITLCCTLVGLSLLLPAAARAQVHERQFGDYLLRANIASVDALPEETVRRHDIGDARALLNIVVLDKAEKPRRTLRASVSATTEDPAGYRRELEMREVIASGRTSYVGAIPSDAPQTFLEITIEVRMPDGASTRLRFEEKLQDRLP